MPVVLFILAVVWTIYLASWVRSRGDRKGVNSISSFSKHLSILERTSPINNDFAPLRSASAGRPTPIYPAAGYMAPRPSMNLDEARRRRRTVLIGLAGSAVTTLLFVPFLGGFAVVLHLLCDVSFVAYVALLMRSQRLAAERSAKVVYLPHLAPAGEPQFYLHQATN